jgi:hypothetical protein
MELTMIIRLRKLQWVGRVTSFTEKGYQRKPLKGYLEGRRPVGKPRGKWLDAVGREVNMMFKYRDWKRLAEDREAWRWRVEDAKAQVGCDTMEEDGEGPS